MTFADKILAFNRKLGYTGKLPKGIGIMNPFQGEQVISITRNIIMTIKRDI